MSWLGALLAGLVSAFVPVTPVEPYLVGMVAAGRGAPVPLALAAAVGQSAGKLVLFLGARGLVRCAWLRRRTRSRTRTGRLARLLALLDRPALTIPILLLSAVTGVPPLLATAVHAARTPMRWPVFLAVCLAGRSARFVIVALAPHLV